MYFVVRDWGTVVFSESLIFGPELVLRNCFTVIQYLVLIFFLLYAYNQEELRYLYLKSRSKKGNYGIPYFAILL